MKSIIDKLLYEWNLVNAACISKVKKLEKLKSRLNELDQRLNAIRDKIHKFEVHLSVGIFSDGRNRGSPVSISDFRSIAERKCKLESVLESMHAMDGEVEAILEASVHANRIYFGASRQNDAMIVGLRERWSALKRAIRDRLFKINNIWILVTDLDDQMNNFYQTLNKTEAFYRNICAPAADTAVSDSSMIRQIGELYLIINQDYKLIKYLNESYICLVRLVCSLEPSNECLGEIKRKLLDINARWDALHNEIALRIKSVSPQTFFFY